MEPRPFSRGNLAVLPLIHYWPPRNLQWSRDLSVAETSPLNDVTDRVLDASMEPRPFSRGNTLRAGDGRRGRAASMEPRPFSRGNGPGVTDSPSLVVASMDAATFQSRKPISSIETAVTVTWLQWSRDLSVAETSRNRRDQYPGPHYDPFNGAATFQSRKPHRASDATLAGCSFNGAATFQSRKPPSASMMASAISVLQWSRDLSVAETTPSPALHGWVISLQWSRDLSDAET